MKLKLIFSECSKHRSSVNACSFVCIGCFIANYD